ncbi:TIGR04197 family type VII secretion effector [Staphylococcus sp. ACRSN]|uniref:TIGR04197 family type VII secretion effector n=1 Tax=Staphylococcus sp. ACRSN TaxID=2918214 RepID=UPI001EF36BF4|nr:TIGR04197 family type VII secretion effector [Staphylococcus sp. ACRSN]MCG7337696.1 TIGR04197 family type VII secretion effector [Staphylococcus sp. ACRSN]
MGEVKVETGSTSGKISEISNSGANVKLSSVSNALSGTDISPFTDFAGAIETLNSAVANYSSIITQDAKAMQTAVDDFENNDNDMANQISENTNTSVNAN